jgi:ribosomal protein L7/L12
MKILLTKPELLKILSTHFDVEVTDLTVHKTAHTITKLREGLARTMVRNGHTPITDTADLTVMARQMNEPSHKIPAIKALRTVVQDMGLRSDIYGLAEAKWAVENWCQFCDYLINKGKLPKVQYMDGKWIVA